MGYRSLYINIIGAKELKNVRHFGRKMRVYAIVSISGSHNNEQYTTPVDTQGHRNPNWNYNMTFTVDADDDENRLTLVFKLRCQRTLGDRKVSEFHVPLTDLLSGGDVEKFVKYQVRNPSGEQLNFSYKFINTDEPQLGHGYSRQQGSCDLPFQAHKPKMNKNKMGKALGAVGAVGAAVATEVAGSWINDQLDSDDDKRT